jgi:tetratricopeptide (TPR) repeat protein
MSPAEAVFFAALEKVDPAERAAYLNAACGADVELRRRVDRLLEAHPQVGSFLREGAADVPAPLVAKGPGLRGGASVDLPLVSERAGTVIGSYKLLEQIGEGGFGVVFLAEQTEPVRRKVALKVLKPGMDTRQVVARFEAERQALALMDHPHIAHILDGGETALGRPYFVMELVRGAPITEFCDLGQLPVRQRLQLFLHVCQAVQHAHQKGVIHRDLKPSNVLVTLQDGTALVKVIDFGIAKALGQQLTDRTVFTGFAQLIGTPLYMSPEQAALSNVDVDTRSDIYSLGVLLYELLTGTTPFDKERLKALGYGEMLRIICEEDPPRPSTRLAESKDTLASISAQRQTEPKRLTKLVRGELDWIVMKALEKDRNRRYESASAFAQDVQRYLADEPVQACPPSAWYRFRKFARRNRAAMLLTVAAMAFLVVAGAGIWSWQHQETLRSAEQGFHTELTRRGVESSLEQLKELQRRAMWQQAEKLLDQAELQLGPQGDPALRDKLAQTRRDTAFIKRLDEIRLQKSVIVEGKLNGAGAVPRYRRAFLDNGLDMVSGAPAELAARLNASAVRDYLLAALDDWAMVEDANNRQRILTITAAVTGQAWRGQLSDLGEDGVGLAQVYDAIPEKERTPAIICAVAIRLEGLIQDGIGRLEQGLRQYRGDFWLHFSLGHQQQLKDRPDAAIGAYRAALALRPGTSAVLNNLGTVLYAKKEYDAASAELQEAIRLDPNWAPPHNNLGNVLYDKKEYDAASAQYKAAIRLDPTLAPPHYGLGNVLRDKKEYDAASAELQEASRLDPSWAQPHYGLGNVLGDKKEYDAASAELQEAIRLNPNWAPPHHGLGTVLFDKKEYDAASAKFKEASRLDPKLAQPHNGLGTVLYAKKEYDAAIAEYKEAIRLDPRGAFPHCGLGNVLRAKEEYDAAIAEYKEAIRLDPSWAPPHNGLGNVLGDKEEYDAAIAEYKEAIRLDPTLAPPHNNLGNVLYAKKEYDAASAQYKAAIRLDPTLAPPHYGLGNVLYAKKEYDAASAEFQEAIRLDPNYAQPHNGLGTVLYARKEYDAASAEFQEAIRLDPNYAQPHNGLGIVLYTRKEYDAASAQYKEAIRLDPKLAPPHNGLGNVLYDKKEYDAASAEFQEAIRLDPNWARPHNGLGIVLYAKKEYDAAIAQYKAAIGLDPNWAWPHNNLGIVLHAKKEYDAASAEFQEAIRLDPNWAPPHNGLGNVLRAKKEYDAASAEFQEAIRLDEGLAFAHANLGQTYRQLGRLSDSVTAFGKAALLMPKDAQVQKDLHVARQLLALDQQLAAIGQGSAKPKTPADAVGLAHFAMREFKKEYGLAVRLFAAAFAADVKLMAAHRYHAARAACLAAAGKGKEADQLDDQQRADLRHKALAWLRDQVQASSQLLKNNPASAPSVAEELKRWQSAPELSSVRDAKELARLPEAEQQSWRKLWAEVDQLLQQASAAFTETNLQGTLTAKDTEQVHEVKMSAGNTYVIDLTSKDFDTYLRLETAQKKVLAENDDVAPDNLNSRLIFTAKEDGMYRVVATSYQQRGIGAYALRIREFQRKKE